MRVVVLSGQIGFTEGLTCVLDNNIKVTNTGVKRVFGLARPYVNSKRTKGIPEPLAKEQSLTSVDSGEEVGYGRSHVLPHPPLQ